MTSCIDEMNRTWLNRRYSCLCYLFTFDCLLSKRKLSLKAFHFGCQQPRSFPRIWCCHLSALADSLSWKCLQISIGYIHGASLCFYLFYFIQSVVYSVFELWEKQKTFCNKISNILAMCFVPFFSPNDRPCAPHYLRFHKNFSPLTFHFTFYCCFPFALFNKWNCFTFYWQLFSRFIFFSQRNFLPNFHTSLFGMLVFSIHRKCSS